MINFQYFYTNFTVNDLIVNCNLCFFSEIYLALKCLRSLYIDNQWRGGKSLVPPPPCTPTTRHHHYGLLFLYKFVIMSKLLTEIGFFQKYYFLVKLLKKFKFYYYKVDKILMIEVKTFVCWILGSEIPWGW